jgi:hypothetical protein
MNMRPIIQLMDQMHHAQIPLPFIAREQTLHAKMVNMTKSCGIEVRYDNLPNIESFLTNFNQLVL